VKAKDFLKSYRKLDEMIENKMYEAKRWEDIALNISPKYGGEKVQSSGSQQKMADAVAKIIDIENEINERIDELIDLRNDIISVIEQLPPFEYGLLHRIYIQYKTIAEAAWDLDKRSENWGTTTHGRALAKVQMILDERERENDEI
jgi:hypothetical protein